MFLLVAQAWEQDAANGFEKAGELNRGLDRPPSAQSAGGLFHGALASLTARAYVWAMTDRSEDETPPPVSEHDQPSEELQPGREPVFNMPAVVVALIGLCVGIHLVRAFLLTHEQDLWLILTFAFIPLRYSGEYLIDFGAIAGPVTYAFLHGDLGHLAVNMIWLAAFGSPLANRLGNGRFLLFWLVTGFAAVALHYVLHTLDPTPLVGASGAISGMMGAAARFGFQIDRSHGRPAFAGPVLSYRQVLASRMAVTFLAVWFIVNLVAGIGFAGPGVRGQIAWEAHIGGFLAGFFGIRLITGRRHREL